MIPLSHTHKPNNQKPYTRNMQPEGDHRGGSNTSAEMNQQQQNQQQQQQQPPQKCPRCESLNTKFCYYNNYSLSQPRYFCKTCRRYWTQGGTLRNVPVGGGCRKGKRAKTSSSGDGNSRSQLQPPQAQQLQKNLASTGAISSSTPVIMSTSPALGTTTETSALASQYYSGNSGFFSYLQTIHSLNQPQPFSTQPLNVGITELGAGSSNLNLLQGFNVSQHRQMQAAGGQFYHMGDPSSHKSMEVPLYPSEQNLLIQSNRPANTSADHDWPQTFMINKSNASASDHQSAMWSMANPNSPGNFNTNTTSAGPSLNPNQWPDLGGL